MHQRDFHRASSLGGGRSCRGGEYRRRMVLEAAEGICGTAGGSGNAGGFSGGTLDAGAWSVSEVAGGVGECFCACGGAEKKDDEEKADCVFHCVSPGGRVLMMEITARCGNNQSRRSLWGKCWAGRRSKQADFGVWIQVSLMAVMGSPGMMARDPCRCGLSQSSRGLLVATRISRSMMNFPSFVLAWLMIASAALRVLALKLVITTLMPLGRREQVREASEFLPAISIRPAVSPLGEIGDVEAGCDGAGFGGEFLQEEVVAVVEDSGIVEGDGSAAEEAGTGGEVGPGGVEVWPTIAIGGLGWGLSNSSDVWGTTGLISRPSCRPNANDLTKAQCRYGLTVCENGLAFSVPAGRIAHDGPIIHPFDWLWCAGCGCRGGFPGSG